MKRKNQTIFKTEKKHRQSLNYTPLESYLTASEIKPIVVFINIYLKLRIYREAIRQSMEIHLFWKSSLYKGF